MGLDFEFVADEGPRILAPIRTAAQARALRTDRTEDLTFVARAIEKVAAHFAPPRADGDQLGIIGFCGAPFTLASYMIEGGSSRNYIETKQMMYSDPASWRLLLDKIVAVLEEYCRLQVAAGADVIQIFDSWVGFAGPGRLSRLRLRGLQAPGLRRAADGRSSHLLWRRNRGPSGANGIDRSRRHRFGLAAAPR
jgi:uroporphyrinogen decarboxylase